MRFKFLTLALLIATLLPALGQRINIQVTPYTQDLLTSPNAATARSKLGAGTGGGSVSSVAIQFPGIIFSNTVTGSPITSSGTFLPALIPQAANTVLRGPTSGANAVPTFGNIVSADLLAGVLLTNAVSTGSGTVSNALTVVNSAGDLVATLGAPAGTNPTHEFRGNVYINPNGTNALGRLGIGTSNPSRPLSIQNANGQATIGVQSTVSNSVSGITFIGDLGGNHAGFFDYNNSATAGTLLNGLPDSLFIQSGSLATNGLLLGTQISVPIVFYTGGTAFSNERMRILGTGGINMAGPLVVTNTGLSIGGASYMWPGAVGSAGSVLTDVAGNGTLSWSTKSPIVASGRLTGQTTAIASVVAYTCGASDGSFLISGNVNVTVSSAEAFNLQVTYTDETNTSRTQTMPLVTLAGTSVVQVNFANSNTPYEGTPIHVLMKASTTATVKTVGTFTGSTYNVESIIRQIN